MSGPINIDINNDIFYYLNTSAIQTSGCFVGSSYTTGIQIDLKSQHKVYYTAQCVNCNKFFRNDKLYSRVLFVTEIIQCPHCGAEG